MKRALGELVSNLRLVAFLIGFAVFYAGVSGFSRPAANVVAGVLVMTVAAGPYLARWRKG